MALALASKGLSYIKQNELLCSYVLFTHKVQVILYFNTKYWILALLYYNSFALSSSLEGRSNFELDLLFWTCIFSKLPIIQNHYKLWLL